MNKKLCCGKKRGTIKKALLAIVVAAVFIGCKQEAPPSNSVLVLMPYKDGNTWVFDDPQAGIVREPFVGGVPELMDKLVKDIPDAHKGFRLYFSARFFPGATHKLLWLRGDQNGNWYYSEEFKAEGWLSKALFKYFKAAPKQIYVRADQK